MSIAAHFHHRCTILRVTATSEDPLGGPGGTATTTVYEGPCRFVEKTERVGASDRAELVVVTRYQLFLPPDAGVMERDTVSTVETPEMILINVFRVRSVKVRRTAAAHHLTVELERAS